MLLHSFGSLSYRESLFYNALLFLLYDGDITWILAMYVSALREADFQSSLICRFTEYSSAEHNQTCLST